jgi:hypothetical protein
MVAWVTTAVVRVADVRLWGVVMMLFAPLYPLDNYAFDERWPVGLLGKRLMVRVPKIREAAC